MNDDRFEELWNSKEVEILQGINEMRHLYRKVELLKPKNIVEIGVEQGGTMRFWVEALQDGGKAIGVDASQHTAQHIARHYDIKSFLPNKQIILVQGNSQNPATIAKVKELLNGEEIDFLFIDGSHEYPDVKEDFDFYFPMVRKGGLIAFDDVTTNCPGVLRSWEEIKGRMDKPYIYDTLIDAFGTGIGTKA